MNNPFGTRVHGGGAVVGVSGERPVNGGSFDITTNDVFGIWSRGVLVGIDAEGFLSGARPVNALIKAIPRPEKVAAKEFALAAEELFDRIMQMTDNAGATDENRALNYLAMRYPAIYAKAAEEFGRDFSLAGVEVRPSP
jgi:hypothetical protein